MKDIEVINDPQAIKIAMDETRSAILQALRFGSLSIQELSIILGKDNSTIYRHVKKLEEAGLVRESRKEKRKKGLTTLYERTAKNFIISTDSFFRNEELKEFREKKEYLVSDILEKIGYKVKDRNKFDEYFYEINKFAFDKILQYGGDMDNNTLREIYSILAILYVQEKGLNFMDLFHESEG